MVAQMTAPRMAGLPLLMEPARPNPRVTRRALVLGQWGWRFDDLGARLVRWREDDASGALVQHVIVRYLVHGVTRQEIAREVGYSQRQVQAWINGRAKSSYAEPVREALRALGIGMRRGQFTTNTHRRVIELANAALALLGDVPWLLATDTRPEAVRVRTLARLLTAGREPLGGHQ